MRTNERVIRYITYMRHAISFDTTRDMILYDMRRNLVTRHLPHENEGDSDTAHDVLQCVAVCWVCCVAVCCSVLQHITWEWTREWYRATCKRRRQWYSTWCHLETPYNCRSLLQKSPVKQTIFCILRRNLATRHAVLRISALTLRNTHLISFDSISYGSSLLLSLSIPHDLRYNLVTRHLSLCVAVCCSVLQCVAVCCSVLQCMTTDTI